MPNGTVEIHRADVKEAELREISQRFAEAVKGNNPSECFYQFSRILSHVQSEQRVIQFLENQLNKMRKVLFGDEEDLEKKGGLVQTVISMKKTHEANRKLLLTIGTAVVIGVIDRVASHFLGK